MPHENEHTNDEIEYHADSLNCTHAFTFLVGMLAGQACNSYEFGFFAQCWMMGIGAKLYLDNTNWSPNSIQGTFLTALGMASSNAINEALKRI